MLDDMFCFDGLVMYCVHIRGSYLVEGAFKLLEQKFPLLCIIYRDRKCLQMFIRVNTRLSDLFEMRS